MDATGFADVVLPDKVSSVEEYIYLYDRLQAGKYTTLSVFSLMLFEYIITLDQEVKYIWSSRPYFTMPKVLFAIVRYMPLATSFVRWYVIVIPGLAFDVCDHGINFTAWAGVISTASIEVILMLRIWALYGKSRKVLIFFSVITIVATAGALVLIQFNPAALPGLAPVAPISMSHCTHGNPTEYVFLFLILAGIELTIFVMLVRKAHRIGSRKTAPLVSALLRHGAAYFAVVFVCLMLASVAPLIWYIAQPIMDSEFTVNVSAIACIRLVFSLKGLREDEEETRRTDSTPLPRHAPKRRRAEDTDADIMFNRDATYDTGTTDTGASMGKFTQSTSVTDSEIGMIKPKKKHSKQSSASGSGYGSTFLSVMGLSPGTETMGTNTLMSAWGLNSINGDGATASYLEPSTSGTSHDGHNRPSRSPIQYQYRR